MDQIKTGKFIAARRKALALTQRELADKLGISDKTVSKWETGNGMPELSLMLPLCQELEINVNELLSGQCLSETAYLEKAEENMMSLMREREESKKKLILASVVTGVTLLAGIIIVLLAGLLDLSTPVRIVLLTVSLLIIGAGIAVACVLDRDAGTFECRNCSARFVPSMRAYIAGPHSLTTRYLKCPECGRSTYCKKRLSK